MSKFKYLSIISFSRQMEATVFINLEIFFATLVVFKIGEYIYVIYRAGGLYGKKLCPRF